MPLSAPASCLLLAASLLVLASAATAATLLPPSDTAGDGTWLAQTVDRHRDIQQISATATGTADDRRRQPRDVAVQIPNDGELAASAVYATRNTNWLDANAPVLTRARFNQGTRKHSVGNMSLHTGQQGRPGKRQMAYMAGSAAPLLWATWPLPAGRAAWCDGNT